MAKKNSKGNVSKKGNKTYWIIAIVILILLAVFALGIFLNKNSRVSGNAILTGMSSNICPEGFVDDAGICVAKKSSCDLKNYNADGTVKKDGFAYQCVLTQAICNALDKKDGIGNLLENPAPPNTPLCGGTSKCCEFNRDE